MLAVARLLADLAPATTLSGTHAALLARAEAIARARAARISGAPASLTDTLLADTTDLLARLLPLGQVAVPALSHMLWDHVRLGDVDVALAVLRAMHDGGITPDLRGVAAASVLVDLARPDDKEPSNPPRIQISSSATVELVRIHRSILESAQIAPSDPSLALLRIELLCSHPAWVELAPAVLAAANLSAAQPALVLDAHRVMLAAAVAFKRDIVSAERLFAAPSQDYGVAPDRKLYTALMRAHVALANRERVLELDAAMRAAGIRPDAATFVALLNAHALDGDAPAALAVLAECADAGIAVSMPMLAAVLVAHVRNPDALAMDAAESFAADHILGVHTVGTSVFNIMIHGYARRGMLARMLEWFDMLLAQGCRPDAFTYSSLKYGVFSSAVDQSARDLRGSFDQIFERRAEMPVQEVRSVVSDTIELNYYLRSGSVEQGVSWFESNLAGGGMHEPDMAAYTNLLAALVQNGGSDEALALFDIMTERNFRPDADVYEQLMRLCIRSPGREYQSFQLLESMMAAHITPTPQILVILIRLCLRFSDSSNLDGLIQLATVRRRAALHPDFYTQALATLVHRTTTWGHAASAAAAILRDMLAKNAANAPAILTSTAQLAIAERCVPVLSALAHISAAVQAPLAAAFPADAVISALCTAVSGDADTAGVGSADLADAGAGAHAVYSDAFDGEDPAGPPPADTELSAVPPPLRALVRFVPYAVAQRAVADFGCVRECLRCLGAEKEGLAIFRLWHALEAAKPALALPADLPSLVLEQLGIYARDEALARRMWEEWAAAPAAGTGAAAPTIAAATALGSADTGAAAVTPADVQGADLAEETPATKPAQSATVAREPRRLATPPRESDVWTFVRVLIWWGKIDEAEYWATEGVLALGIPVQGDLVRQFLNWARLKQMPDVEHAVRDFWTRRRPEWFQADTVV
ncbi:hypothetical protein HK105_207069 [Polyrhizophydium stewartii]|uniref:Pentatricopeptide repeat-containing protein n=1 Tax=Polyrhizophydium stewartii TaxID=2732419 RepID=A0ABR4N1T7_9FUNG